MKVKELKGLESVRAYNAYQLILLGTSMLPKYSNVPYDEFLDNFSKAELEKKKMILKDGLYFITLSDDDARSLLKMVEDNNGVAITDNNIGNFSTKELLEAELEVLVECSKCEVFF